MDDDYIEIEGEGVVYWPMCPIKNCPNRICLSLGSKYCWPHTGSGKGQTEFISELSELPENMTEACRRLRVPSPSKL